MKLYSFVIVLLISEVALSAEFLIADESRLWSDSSTNIGRPSKVIIDEIITRWQQIFNNQND
jgi:hypothetical protein